MDLSGFPTIINIFDEFDSIETNRANIKSHAFNIFLNDNCNELLCEYLIRKNNNELINHCGKFSGFLNKTTYQVFRNSISSAIEEKFQVFLNSTDSEIFEICIPLIDHSNLIYLKFKRQIIHTNDDSAQLLLSICNISEQKLKELAISELKVNYFTTINNARSIIFSFDENMRLFNANSKALSVFGLNSIDISKTSVDELFADEFKHIPNDSIKFLERGEKYFKYGLCVGGNRKNFNAEIHIYKLRMNRKTIYSASIVEINSGNSAENDKTNEIIAHSKLCDENTKLKNRNSILLKSEEKYSSLFMEMGAAFAYHKIILNKQGLPIDYVFIEVNKAFELATGLKAENIIDKRVKSVLPTTEDIWIQKYGEVALTGTSINFEHYSEALDRHYSVFAYSPKKYFFATIFTDITKIIKLQKELRESRTKYKLLSENSLIGIWQIGRNGETQYMNPQMKKYLEIPETTLLIDIDYKNYFASHYANRIESVFNTNSIFSSHRYQAELISANGNIKQMLISPSVLAAESGDILSYIGNFSDISDIIKYQKALAMSEKKFRIISDYANNWEIFCDPEGNISYSNPYSVKILGLHADYLDLYHFSDLFSFVHPDDVDRVKQYLVDSLDKCNVNDLKFKIKSETRGFTDVSLSSQPVFERSIFIGTRISISDIAKLSYVEKSFTENEHKYKVYIDNSPYGLFIFDNSLRFIDVNIMAIAMTQYTQAELLEMGPFVITPVADHGILKEFWIALQQNGTATAKVLCNVKNSEPISIQVDAVVLANSKYLAFVQDITSKIRSEKQLKLTEANLRAIIDNNQEAILLIDKDFKVVEFNLNSKNLLFEVSNQKLEYGIDVRTYMSDLYRKILVDNYYKCFKGELVSFDSEYKSINGDTYYFHVSFQPVRRDNEIIGSSLSLLDITEHKKLEIELLHSKLHYELIINNIHDIVALLNKEAKYAFVNKRFTEVMGYTSDEVIGKSPIDFIHPDELEDIIERIKAIRRGDNLNSVDIHQYRHKEGHYLTLENNATTFKNAYGEKATAIIARDITDELKVRKAIYQSEAEMRLLMDGIPIMIAHIDTNLDIKFANRAFCKFFLNSDEYKYILKLSRLLKPDYYELVSNSLDQAFAGETQVIEGNTTDINGEFATLNAILVPHWNSKSLYFIANNITVQLKNEAAYKYQTEFNYAMLQTVGAMIIGLDNHGKIMLFNAAAEEVTGYKSEFVLNRFYFDFFVNENEIELFANNLNLINERRLPLKFNDYIITKSGDKRQIEWSNTLMQNDESEGYYIICTGLDITEMKKAEQTVQNITLGVTEFIGDEFFQSLVLKINEVLESDYVLIGEIIDSKLIRSLSYCDRTTILPNFEYNLSGTPTKRAIDNGIYSYSEQVRLIFPEDEILNQLQIEGYVCIPLYSSYKEPIGVMIALFKNKILKPMVVENIMRIFAVRTVAEIERLNAEEELLYKEESFRAIAENSPDIIMRFNRELQFIYASSGIYELTGVDSDDISGRSIDEMYFSDELKKIWKDDIIKVFSDALIVERIFSIEIDGINAFYDWRLIPEYNANNDIITVLALARDFTKQKLDEQEIIEAKEKAEESDKLKSAFLANMSHELRTPLNAIIGFSNLLKYPDLDEEEKVEYINIISDRGNDLLKLLSDIIDLSKIESGNVSFSPSQFALNDFLYVAYEEYTKLAEKKYHKVIQHKLSIPDVNQELWVNTDKLKLRQIINNLYENSMKFTNEGFVQFGYTIVPSGIEIFVKDSGIGIPKDKINIIFDRFRQADDSHNKLFGGAGLGLSIATKLIQMFKGQIRVESEVNIGTTFYVTLPMEYEIHIDTGRNNYLANIDSDINLQDKKILVAEDDSSNYLLIEKYLTHYGANVVRADNGVSCLNIMVNDSEIKAIFMDIRMPQMNGYETAKEIRLINSHIPIIACTSYAYIEDKQLAIEAGCDEYLTKPIVVNELERILLKYLV